jgi:hypothetical protein
MIVPRTTSAMGSGVATTACGGGATATWTATSIRVALNSFPVGTSQTLAGAPTYWTKVQNGTLVEFTSTAV